MGGSHSTDSGHPMAVPPFSGCVTLGESLSLSVPLLSYLYNEGRTMIVPTSYVPREDYIP